MVTAIRTGRPPLTSLEHDLHLIEILDAARRSSISGAAVPVESTFEPLDLTLEEPEDAAHVHDHTRPPDEQ